jgi:signal transduction histidine kinase
VSRPRRADARTRQPFEGRFLAALSHELRTPLNAIVGWAELLKRRIDPSDPRADARRGAIARSAVQTQLIADLLDISRDHSGKQSLDDALVRSAGNDRGVGERAADRAKSKDVTIQTESLEPIGEIPLGPGAASSR